MARVRYKVMVEKRELIRNNRARTLGKEGKGAARFVGVSGLDYEPSPRGVNDVHDTPGSGPGHMAADKAPIPDEEMEQNGGTSGRRMPRRLQPAYSFGSFGSRRG